MNVSEMIEQIKSDPGFQEMPEAAQEEVIKQVHEVEFLRVTSHDRIVQFLKATLGTMDLTTQDLKDNQELVTWFVQMFTTIFTDVMEHLIPVVNPKSGNELQELIHRTYVTLETLYELAEVKKKKMPNITIAQVDHSECDCDHDDE